MHPTEAQAQSHHTSQCDAIFAILAERFGQWVDMPELCRLTGSYVIHSRIADLRRQLTRRERQLPAGLPEAARPLVIQNRAPRPRRGVVQSAYRLTHADN